VDIFPTENARPSTVPNKSVNPPGTSSGESDEPDRPNVIPFDLNNDQEDTKLTNQDDVTSSLDASAELMRWHLRLGHLPFANIWLMAVRKEIPSWLANCRIPKCQSCLYGKATKRPWRTKGQSGTLKEVSLPGQCVAVDQLESPVAGFIKDSSFASATRLLQSLWTISASCLMFTSKSQQKGCLLWLPRDRLKPIPLPMESRSNNTMPTMGDLLSTYSSITGRNRVRRYPYVESVHTSLGLAFSSLSLSLSSRVCSSLKIFPRLVYKFLARRLSTVAPSFPNPYALDQNAPFRGFVLVFWHLPFQVISFGVAPLPLFSCRPFLLASGLLWLPSFPFLPVVIV
jgi:hypothetical protein